MGEGKKQLEAFVDQRKQVKAIEDSKKIEEIKATEKRTEQDLSIMMRFLNETCGLSTNSSSRISRILVFDLKLDTVRKLERKQAEELQRLLESSSVNREEAEMILEVLSKRASPASPAAATLGQQRWHIMLSYNWTHKEVVRAVHALLVAMGYDVWIDVSGSSVVGPMAGDSDDIMAQAVENSEVVVIFVSRQYMNSAACKKEAQYASQVKKRCVFVMLDSSFTTVSSPEKVSGWLALMIGTQIWYSCFSEKDVPTVSTELATKVFGELCRR